jgi:hypothetical protein
MMFLAYMKMNIRHAVESSYEFDTSRAPNIISRNASHAQALLAKMTSFTKFVSLHRHLQRTENHLMGHRSSILAGAHIIHIDTIIQKVVYVTWSQNKDDIGNVFHEYFKFAPIPFKVIALALTVVSIEATCPFPDVDGLCPLLLGRVLHRRVVYWQRHMQRVRVERRALQYH